MVKVIAIKKYLDTLYTTNCQCGAKLEFSRSDVQVEKHKVYFSSLRIDDYSRNYIECPNCKNIIYEDEYNWEEVIND